MYSWDAPLGSLGIRIVDWRGTPISKLFYRYEEGDEYAEEVAERIREGEVKIRRTMHIANGALQRVDAADTTFVLDGEAWTELSQDAQQLSGGQGAALRAGRRTNAQLGSGEKLRADKHLPDIAALIDPEQFELITGPTTGWSSCGVPPVQARPRWRFIASPTSTTPTPTPSFPLESSSSCGDGPCETTWPTSSRHWASTESRHDLGALGAKHGQAALPQLPNHVSDDTQAPVVRVKLHPGVAEALAKESSATRACAP